MLDDLVEKLKIAAAELRSARYRNYDKVDIWLTRAYQSWWGQQGLVGGSSRDLAR